jgi:SAM-dependent methyltransferase
MNDSINHYRCTSCGHNHLTLQDKDLVCANCNTVFNFNVTSGCFNFLTKEEKDDLFLKEINLEDLEETKSSAGGSQIRLYSEEDYLNSDYAKNLFAEFNLEDDAFVLDHGCGRGHFSEYFAKKGYKVASADILEDALAGLDSDKKAVCNLAKLPYKDNTFDGVFSLDVFEHLIPDTMDFVIEEIYRVLKPGGVMLISFPGNRIPDLVGRHFVNIFVFFLRLFGSSYPYMRTNKIKAHINLNTPSHFRKAFKRAGFLGDIKPYSNKFMTLPRKLVFLARLLNFPLIAPLFIHQIHGLVSKPND